MMEISSELNSFLETTNLPEKTTNVQDGKVQGEVKVHKCDICDKEFNKKSNLKRHLKTHNTNKEPVTEVSCVICDRSYKLKSSLDRHIKKVHLVSDDKETIFPCDKCDYKAKFKQSLIRHKSKFHISANQTPTLSQSTVNSDLPSKQNYFKCVKCTAKYKNKGDLKTHERKAHQREKLLRTQISFKCPKCSFTCTGKDEVYNHFERQHHINIEKEKFEFQSLEEFRVWKREVEHKTNSSFIKVFSTSRSISYKCHRCGVYTPKGNAKRHLKLSGSCKINSFCPAMIKVNIFKETIKILYTKTHVGHTCDLRYLRLSKEDKALIASKLACKIPHEEILRGIRSTTTDAELHRIQITNLKDIVNIEKSFNLNMDSVKHEYDPISVAAWVENLKCSESTALLEFKSQGVLSQSFPQLNKNDFLFVYMSEAQKSLLVEFGKDVICIDGTHGLNSYDFQLYTILILDETREGFPVCFMFTNRGDETVVSLLFQLLLNTVGEIHPKVFMSDMEETFYCSWKKIMGEAGKQLFCAWHVLRAWHKNVRNKVKCREKQDYVYKTLRTLLYELDGEAFSRMANEFMARLSQDDDTKQFAHYFVHEYMRRVENWAYCHRLHAGINTNMSMESFNKVLKYCYLRGKKVKRLDKTLHSILNLVQDKLFDLIIKMKRGKLVKKLQLLRQRHKHGSVLERSTLSQIEPQKWQVLSETNTDIYTVEKICNCRSCLLQCLYCNSCFHEFVCSCMDHAIKNNMCKHIHLVASSVSNVVAISTGNEDSSVIAVEKDFVKKVIDETGCIGNHEKIFEIEKKKMVEELEELVQCVETVDQINYVRNQIKSIRPTLDALKPKEIPAFEVVASTSTTRSTSSLKMSPQKRFTTTKKKRQGAKPKKLTSEEKLKISIDLMQ